MSFLLVLNRDKDIATFVHRNHLETLTRNTFANHQSLSCVRELIETESNFLNREAKLMDRLYNGEGKSDQLLMCAITTELDYIYEEMKKALNVKQINIGLNG